MRTLDEARSKILGELKGAEDEEIRGEFWSRYEKDIEAFVEAMSNAYVEFNKIEAQIRGDEGRGVVVALAYTALTLNLLSMKLFLSGHIVAAGALFRQVLEAIAIALLSSRKDLGVRSSFSSMAGGRATQRPRRTIDWHPRDPVF